VQDIAQPRQTWWEKTPVPNLVRYGPSGTLFARVRVKGKLIRRSLKRKALSIGKLRLADLEKAERQSAEHAIDCAAGKMTFADALAIYRARLHGDASLEPRTKAHREERIAAILKTWTGLEKIDVRKITKQDCLLWAAGYKTSAVNFNKTVQTLRVILEVPIEAGIRYDNPARFIRTMKVRLKPLQLPTRAQFHDLVKSVRTVNKRFSQDAADLIEFLAYGGFRKSEAENIRWADCDFGRGEILVRGDPETGTKNCTVRTVPMIPEMRQLLDKLSAESPQRAVGQKVVAVFRCNGSLKNACQRLGIEPLMKQLYYEARARGLTQAQQVLAIADGAVWIWNLVEDRFQEAEQRLDLFHANTYLWAVANELHGTGTPQARQWVKPLLKQIRNDQVAKVITQLEDLKPQLAQAAAKAAKAADDAIDYYQKNQKRMKYKKGRKRNEPVGSGAIESTCRQLQCRMKRCGQFWSTRGDEALLCLEMFWRNERWELLFPHAKLTAVANN
jgi:integrase